MRRRKKKGGNEEMEDINKQSFKQVSEEDKLQCHWHFVGLTEEDKHLARKRLSTWICVKKQKSTKTKQLELSLGKLIHVNEKDKDYAQTMERLKDLILEYLLAKCSQGKFGRNHHWR